MDKSEKKKITSNITFLKERLAYLDPIIDILVDKKVLSNAQRDRIVNVNPPTPHKKFNIFMQCLLGSSDPNAFTGFIQALEEERYFNIVEKLYKEDGRSNNSTSGRAQSSYRDTKTEQQRPTTSRTIRPITAVSKDSNVSFPLRPEREFQAPSRSDTITPCYADRVTVAIGQMFAEFSGKLTNDLLDGFERRRHEDRMELELKLERKIETEVEKRLDDKINDFKEEWDGEKQKLLERNEKAIGTLQESIEQLQESSEAYNELKTKYEQLQQSHSMMREKENERWQRLCTVNKENAQIRNENECLRAEVESMQERFDELDSDNKALKDNEVQDQHRIAQLMAEKEDLLMELERSEREKGDLRMRVESLSREIERLMAQQQERANQDDKVYQDALKKQNERLDELYKVVHALTERERQAKSLFVGGNAVQKNARSAVSSMVARNNKF